MRVQLIPIGELLDFFNGKAPNQVDDGEFVLYGSNGKIGRSKSFNHENSIILGRVGAYCGSVEVCLDRFWASDNTIVIKTKKGYDLRYMYYRLLSFPLRSYAGGAAQPLLTQTILRGIKLQIFTDLLIQQRIASILSAYDDLIENNRRRIQLLEQAARLLYKEWFVHLRFPGHEHVKIKDGVPEGWEKKTIGSVSSFISRGITPSYDDEALGTVINQKCIRDQRVTIDFARRQSKEVPPNKLVRYGDVLVNSTGQGTLGRVAQFLDVIENFTVDSHVTIARPYENVPVFLYGHHIASMEDYLASMGRGATNQTELSKDVVAELAFLRPPHLLTEQFESFAKDTADQVRNLTQQNTALTQARDLLLPRLMNGDLVV